VSILKRRTYLKAADRRAQILEVAKDVFARRGVRDAQISDICEAAHIGRGTLYQYFENKRAVLLAVIDAVCARMAARLEKRTPVADLPGVDRAPRELIVAVTSRRLREMLDAVFEDESSLRLILRDARGLDGLVDEALARVDALLLDACEDDLRASQRAGILRAEIDPALAARFVIGGVEKVVLTKLASDEPVDLDALVAALVHQQLFGLLRPEVSR